MDKEFNIQCERCKISEFKIIKNSKDEKSAIATIDHIEKNVERYANTISYCDNIEECEARFNEEARILMGSHWKLGERIIIAWRFYQGEGIDNFWRIYGKSETGFEVNFKIEGGKKDA